MLVKGTNELNELSEGILWVPKSEGLEFDTGNITRLSHYFIMRKYERIK